nr:hypothetical protein 13 [Piscirickettsiaceae bacterium]
MNLAPQAKAFIGMTSFPPKEYTFEELYEMGYTHIEIADRLNMSANDVIAKASAYNKKKKTLSRMQGTSFPIKVKVQAVQLLNEGLKLKEVKAFVEKKTKRTTSMQTIQYWKTQKSVIEAMKKINH